MISEKCDQLWLKIDIVGSILFIVREKQYFFWIIHNLVLNETIMATKILIMKLRNIVCDCTYFKGE